jgi:hypothetical protein
VRDLGNLLRTNGVFLASAGVLPYFGGGTNRHECCQRDKMPSASTLLVEAATTGGLQAWIRSNVIPLLLLVIAVMLFVVAQRGGNAKAMKVVAGVVIPLGVLGLATSGKAESVGVWMAALVTG